MPASEVMNLYRQHKLHSGPGGPIVKKKTQATAIQISMARKEGHHIPVKGSFQQGGTVKSTGDYLVHEGEDVKKPRVEVGRFDAAIGNRPQEHEFQSLIDPATGEWPGTYDAAGKPALMKGYAAPQPSQTQGGRSFDIPSPEYQSDVKHLTSPAHYRLEGDVWHPELKHRPPPGVKGSFQHGGLVPETGNYQVHQGEEVQRRAQAADIAARTNQAQHDEWNRAMRQREDFGGAMGRGRPSDQLGQPPLPRDVPPAGNDPHYAIRGLQGSVAQRMREQGERAAGIRGSFDQGGTVEQTGDYKAHQGEEIVPPAKTGGQSDLPVGRELIGSQADMVPPIRAIAPGPSTSIQNVPKKGAAPPVGGNPALEQMQAAVAAPLQRASSNFDAPPASYKTGGTIPRTGVYRLHAGEHVIPASLAKRYREMKK